MSAYARRLLVPFGGRAARRPVVPASSMVRAENGIGPEPGRSPSRSVLARSRLIVLMIVDSRNPEAPDVEIASPRFARYPVREYAGRLFWLPIRIFVGFEWLEAGAATVADGWLDGSPAPARYWERAVAITEAGRPPISFEWYRAFLQ